MLYNMTTMATTWHTVATRDTTLLREQLDKVFADITVTVTKNGTTVKAAQMMKLMGLGVKQDAAITALSDFFHNNL